MRQVPEPKEMTKDELVEESKEKVEERQASDDENDEATEDWEKLDVNQFLGLALRLNTLI